LRPPRFSRFYCMKSKEGAGKSRERKFMNNKKLLNRWLFFRPIAIKSYDAIKLAINRFSGGNYSDSQKICNSINLKRCLIFNIFSLDNIFISMIISLFYLSLVARSKSEYISESNNKIYPIDFYGNDIIQDEAAKQTTLLTIYRGL
jgi:hypothetical protein